MPVLSLAATAAETEESRVGARLAIRAGLLERCANPGCASGWLHLWRSRSAPVFEGGWNCSAACTEERMRAAVRREFEGRASGPAGYRHRMPLGLLMMEQGWITRAQLKLALEAQKAAGVGRLGDFLVRQQAVTEQHVTRALSLQWSCPVLPLPFHDPEGLSPVMPRLFVDAFGALPLRVAAGRLLYLGFEERLDAVLALAVERMSGLRVEGGLVPSSEFLPAHRRMLKAVFPRVQLLEAVSEPALVRALARTVERVRPVESRLVRVHDCLWLRMWKKADAVPVPAADSVEDVIGSIGE
jgi:Type II secretion system (T2SS), protein E, N-terminal domain